MRSRARLRHAAWIGFAALAAAILVIALAPSLLVPWLAARLSTATGADVRIGWMSWNPLAPGVALHRVRLAPRPGEPAMATADAITVNLALRRWLHGEPALDALVISRPWIGLQRTASGDFNLAALAPASITAPPTLPIAGPEPPVLRIDTVRIEGGSLEFRDESAQPAVETSVHLEHALARDLAIIRGGGAVFALHMESRLEQAPLTLDVTYRAAGDDSDLEVGLMAKHTALDRALLYLPLGWQRVTGTMDATFSYDRHVRAGRLQRNTVQAEARVNDLAITEPDAAEPSLRARAAELRRITVDLIRRRTDLGTIAIDGFHAIVARDDEGVRLPLVSAPAGAQGSPWSTVVDAVQLGTGTVQLRDIIPGAEPTIDATVRSAAIHFGPSGASARVEADVAGGAVGVAAEAHGDETALTLDFRDLALPEVAARLRLPVRFEAGRVRGRLGFHFGGGPARVSGALALPDARSAPAAAHPEEVFAWQDLELALDTSTLEPLRVHASEATVTWPYVMLHRRAEGLYPLTEVPLADDSAAAAAPAGVARPSGAGQDPVLVVDHVTVRGGRIEFYDSTLSEPYGIDLVDTQGTLEALVAPPLGIRELRLAGTLDELSPLEIEGTIQPARTELRLRVDRLLLPPLNVYLAPALEHEVRSGLASLRSTIIVQDGRLSADTDLVLSRLAMTAGGDRFAQSAGVPLTVALALIKDTAGDVRIHVPIEGDWGSQEYRIGSVFREAFQRALLGTLSTPLKLLGSMFARDDAERFELEPVPFPPGSAELTREGAARVGELARLLRRYDILRAVLSPDPSVEDLAVSPTDPATPPQAERLGALGAARVAAVAGHLHDVHGIDSTRVETATTGPREPRPTGPPGVDVSLRTQ